MVGLRGVRPDADQRWIHRARDRTDLRRQVRMGAKHHEREGRMTLHIMIAGRERFAAPYDPQNMGATASALNEHLPALRQLGRVVVFVTDGNVAHLIVAS
jgi:hypothetical protein